MPDSLEPPNFFSRVHAGVPGKALRAILRDLFWMTYCVLRLFGEALA